MGTIELVVNYYMETWTLAMQLSKGQVNFLDSVAASQTALQRYV